VVVDWFSDQRERCVLRSLHYRLTHNTHIMSASIRAQYKELLLRATNANIVHWYKDI